MRGRFESGQPAERLQYGLRTQNALRDCELPVGTDALEHFQVNHLGNGEIFMVFAFLNKAHCIGIGSAQPVDPDRGIEQQHQLFLGPTGRAGLLTAVLS